MLTNEQEYRQKVLGCWMGKNIGGTLGAPFEFQRQKNEVQFYTQQLDGNPLPNDDLDIQLLWLVALEEKGLQLNADLLGAYWLLYVTPHWAEYGIAKTNMKAGIAPPLSGTLNNVFKHSNGAFIRSEIWACIAPGNPRVAAQYAVEDAIIDHGYGEGMYAEVFCAALESAAFVEHDLRELVRIGLSYIPEHCAVARAVRCSVDCYDRGLDWVAARDELLTHFRGHYAIWAGISAEDAAKGFGDGEWGFDAPLNIGILVFALFAGEGDFGKTLCMAVNFGEDTDCTAATLGSIFGILYGIDAIPSRWIEPIGMRIRTACLNLGELGVYGDQLPGTISELTDRVTAIARQIAPSQLPLADDGSFRARFTRSHVISHRFDFFSIDVDYGEDGPLLRPGQPKTLTLTVHNQYKISQMLDVRWYGPADMLVSPGVVSKVFSSIFPHGRQELSYTLTLGECAPINRFVIEFTVQHTHTVMLVPIALLHLPHGAQA